MFTVTFVGCLGADAEVSTEQGKRFVKFRVASNRSYTGADGVRREEVIWATCWLHGEQSNLVQYLTKGRNVCVIGDGALKVFSSKQARGMVAGLDINVRQVELLSSPTRFPVPDELFREDGSLVQTQRCMIVEPDAHPGTILVDRRGNSYQVLDTNVVVPHITANAPNSL